MTPLERVETFYRELAEHYHEASDAHLRAATKLLLVAIAEIKRHGGADWQGLLDEYVDIAKRDPAKFERMIQGNRGRPDVPHGDDELLC